MLLPEYKMERMQFEAILDESISALVKIMQTLQLRPIESEAEFEVELEDIGPFEAKVDLLLKNKDNKLVIFDLKWSESKAYQDRLENNLSLQLQLYRMAVGMSTNTTVAGVAYYLFPKMTLFTTDFPKADHIINVSVTAEAAERDLENEIRNSYNYRRGELDEGFIEEGELSEIKNLPYTQASSEETPLCPITPDFSDKEKKGRPYVTTSRPPFAKAKAVWSNSQSDPKEMKTTHPILKGRLV